MSQETKKVKGIITKSIGGRYTVEAPEGLITCKPRGVFRNKGITPVCGDSAEVLVETDGSGVIVEIGERKNVLFLQKNLQILHACYMLKLYRKLGRSHGCRPAAGDPAGEF